MNRTLIAFLSAGACTAFAHAGVANPDQQDQTKPAQAAEDQPKKLAELFELPPRPALWLGSKAPELSIAEWVRGDSVSSFKPGHTYVVEFWASWCGPCIAAFPHLAEIQSRHSDEVTVIGVNIWEQSTGTERAEMVREFVANHPEMRYSVALEDENKMSETWMRPAGRQGIPAAFIVDGEGRIAWIGHPMSMDEPLAEIIKGEYDMKAAEEALRKEELMMQAFMGLRRSVAAEEWNQAYDIGRALMLESFAEMPDGLNAVAWFLADADDAPEKCYKLAYQAATKAAQMTDWEDWSILDTYALAAYRNGDRQKAIEWQTKAIEMAPPEAKPGMQAQLEMFTAQS